jgi:hypothetical protein
MNEFANTPVPILNLPRQDHRLIPRAWSFQTASTGNTDLRTDPPGRCHLGRGRPARHS